MNILAFDWRELIGYGRRRPSMASDSGSGQLLKQKEIDVANHIRQAAGDGCMCEPCIAAREALASQQVQITAKMVKDANESWSVHGPGTWSEHVAKFLNEALAAAPRQASREGLLTQVLAIMDRIGQHGDSSGNLTVAEARAEIAALAPSEPATKGRDAAVIGPNVGIATGANPLGPAAPVPAEKLRALVEAGKVIVSDYDRMRVAFVYGLERKVEPLDINKQRAWNAALAALS
jgi:hypothetical protein